MRNLELIALSALIIVAGVSCNKEIVIDNPVDQPSELEQGGKVTMSFVAGIGTKMHVDESVAGSVVWDANDKIAVWDGTEWCEFAAESVNGSSAVFSGEITPKEGFGKTDFKAVYPFSAIQDVTVEAVSVNVPSAQTVLSGASMDRNALVAVASCSEDGLLSFEHVCALVRIRVSMDGISQVTLGGTGLAGNVVCGTDGVVSANAGLLDSIVLSSEDGTFAAGDYYIATLPASTQLSVGMVRDSDGYTGSRTTASAVTLSRGEGRISIKDTQLTDWEYNIYNSGQLKNCAEKWSASFTETVNIREDIDMSGLTWSAKDFGGVINGNNKRLYGFQILFSGTYSCFINNLTGSIKNILFGAEDGSDSFQINDTSKPEEWHYVAPVVRMRGTKASIEGVKNYASIKVLEGSAGFSRISGIVAVLASNCVVKLKDCANYGTIQYLSGETGAKTSVMAGVTAQIDGSAEIDNCDNYGNLYCNNGALGYIGGVFGFDNGGANVHDCENSGSVYFNIASPAKEIYVGGIGGYAEGTQISNCENLQELTTECSYVKALAGIVGGIVSDTDEGNNKAFIISHCYNRQSIINNSSTYSIGSQVEVAGIAGYVNGKQTALKGTIENCYSKSESEDIEIKAGGDGKTLRLGGIAGYVDYTSVTGCENWAKVKYNTTATSAANYVALGGIVAHSYHYSAINNCKNHASVESNKPNVNRIGGIIGTLNTSSLTACSNEGDITLTMKANNWQGVGGIAGFAEGSGATSYDITGNINKGRINATINSSNARCCVGGILGMPASTFKISGNENRGEITAVNLYGTDPACAVGGILGQDNGNTYAVTIANNINYAPIINNTSVATNAFAGGLFGFVNKATASSGDKSFGDVKGLNAGAIVGKNGTATITATVCDAVTVNGVTRAAAPDDAAWLCPVNSGTITATTVAHSDSE